MANIIKPKRSNTAAKVPNTTELTSGELGVNMADRKVYINNGTAVVQVGAGNLSGLGDVAIATPANGQALTYNSTTSKWENTSAGTGTVTSVGITPGTGVTVSGSPVTTSGNIAVGLSTKLTAIENLSGAGFITQNGSGVIAGRTLQAGTGISIAHGNGSSQDPIITNSAPDQTVALTGAGATTISGTYPNFTITSVNTTYGAATSTVPGLIELGSDTAQTVAANAVSATASRSYALQVNAAGQGVVNVPWTDTNSGGTVTSVGGTGTVSGLSLSGTVTTSGNLTLGGTLAVLPSNFASQTANTVLAAPNGAAGTPTFRALVAADIPALTLENLPDAWVKRAVRAATTANITLSGAQTIDGIAVVAGDRVLVKNQTAAAENGIYVVSATAWSRSADANLASELGAAQVAVDSGTTNGGYTFDNDFKTTDTLGTTAMNWSRVLDAAYLTTVGNSFATLANPSAITFPQINANNTVSALNAASFRTAIGAGTSSTTGTVTSVGGTGTVSGLSLSGTVTTSGNLTLGGTLAVTPSNFASQTANTFLAAPNGVAGVPTFRAMVAADVPTLNQNTTGTSSNVTGTVAVANGGTGATTAAAARTNLGATTLGGNLFTVANVAAIAFPRFNADNTVSSLDAATFRTAIGAGTSSTTGTVTSVASGTGLTGGPITTSGTLSLANTTVTAGSYTNANITVDAQGRLTAASSGSGSSGTVTSVSGTGTVSGLTLTGTVTTSGSLTLGGNLSITADMIYNSFIAAAAQTTFTTTNTYTSGKIDVFVNGVKVINGTDVTVTSGTSVVMAAGLPSGTRVDLVYPI